MKNIKSMLFIATLMAAVVSTASAQQAATQSKEHTWTVSIGDSVMFKRECDKYLTGEKPSAFVYDKVHTVRQLGSKRFPEGVLLMNIFSWTCEECLVPVSHKAKETKTSTAPQGGEETKTDGQKSGDQQQQQQTQQPVDTTSSTPSGSDDIEVQPVDTTPAVKQDVPQGDTVPEGEPNFKYNYHRFTIGARGGAASMLHSAIKGDWTCGGDVLLDLQYAHYWGAEDRKVDLGIIAGLALGYSQSGLNVDYDKTEFKRQDGQYDIDYTVEAKDIKETDHSLQLEVPVMFSLIHNSGVFFNVGPKFMIPLYSPYKQTVDQENTHISAFFEETGVTVTDNEVIGQYTGQQPEADNGIKFKINVMLTAEIGYEWLLHSGNSFALGAYANYSVYNSYKNATNSEGLFQLTAPTNNDKGKLDVLSATHTYADKLGYFDVGIKLAYHFNFPKKQYKEFRSNKLF